MNRYKTCQVAMLILWNVAAAHGGDMNMNAMLLPVPAEAKFQSSDYYTWGGSMVRYPEGKYHLFYSRWPGVVLPGSVSSEVISQISHEWTGFILMTNREDTGCLRNT